MVEAIEPIDLPSLVGEQVDNWRLVKMLGEGGMSIVYLGEHLWLQQKAAIKLLRPEFCRDGAVLQRFQQEALAASSLQHDNIIEVSNFGRDPNHGYFMVLEYLEGVELDEIIERAPLPKGWIVPIVKQICSALHTTHQAQIIHRDLKPSNVFLLPGQGDVPRVKLLDFGIAKVHFESSNQKLTSTGVIVGTPAYLAPEQVVPRRGLTHAVDIYSLGVVTFQMFTGQLPLFAESTIEHVIKVLQVDAPLIGSIRPEFAGTALEAFIARILEKLPENRPMSMQAVWEEFHKAAASFEDPLDIPENYPHLASFMSAESFEAKQKKVAFSTSAYDTGNGLDIAQQQGLLPTGGEVIGSGPAVRGRQDRFFGEDPGSQTNLDIPPPADPKRSHWLTLALVGLLVGMAALLGFVLWSKETPPPLVQKTPPPKTPRRTTFEDLVFDSIKSLKQKKLKKAIRLMRAAMRSKKWQQSHHYPQLFSAMGKAQQERKNLYVAVKYVDRYLEALQTLRKQRAELDVRIQEATQAGRTKEVAALKAALSRLVGRIPQDKVLQAQLKAFGSWRRVLKEQTGVAQKLIQELIKQLERGRFGEAHTTYLEIRKFAPSHPEILTLLAKLLRKRFPHTAQGLIVAILQQDEVTEKRKSSLLKEMAALRLRLQQETQRVAKVLGQAEQAIAEKKWRQAIRTLQRGVDLPQFARSHSQLRGWLDRLRATNLDAATQLWGWYARRWQQIEQKQLSRWVKGNQAAALQSKVLREQFRVLQHMQRIQRLWKQVQAAVNKGSLAHAKQLNQQLLAKWGRLTSEDKWDFRQSVAPLQQQASALQPRLLQSTTWVQRAQTMLQQAHFARALEAQEKALVQLRGTAAHTRWKQQFARNLQLAQRAMRHRKTAQYRTYQLNWRAAEREFKAYLALFPKAHDRAEVKRKIKLCRCGYIQGSWEVCPTRDGKDLLRRMKRKR